MLQIMHKNRKIILTISFLLVVFVCILVVKSTKEYVFADPASTSVTVDNSAPDFTQDPFEDPASTYVSPTNVGSSVTFKATATDPNEHQYYLAICKSDSVTAGNNNPPTCNGGAWCVSNATNSGVQASCSYNAQSGDNESEVWYAFVCDKVSGGGACSDSSQGIGDSGSPFKVNHRPAFTATNGNSADPGGTITFTSTASDSDTDGSSDTVKLVVCDTNSTGVILGSPSTCVGGNLYCESTYSANNPSCNYNVPSVMLAGSHNYRGFIFDNHGLGSGSNYITSSFSINNIAPIVSNISLNGGSNINLTENIRSNVVVTGTVTDSNSCQDISKFTTSLYRSGVTYSNCNTDDDDDYDSCYANVICSVVSSGNICEGVSDSSADYMCTISVEFYADPTDSDTQYSDENWLATIYAQDNGDLYDSLETNVGVEMNSLVALRLEPSSINYGNMAAGTNSGSTNQEVDIIATGNVGIDSEFSGTNMTYSSYVIPVSYQEYFNSSFSYQDPPDTVWSLSSTPTEREVNIPKTYWDLVRIDGVVTIYWGIKIPLSIGAGTYNGTNTITAVKGEVSDW